MKLIRRCIKWGVSEGMIPVAIHETLRCIPSLKRGRSEAKETKPIRPVPDHVVEATLQRLPKVVADMVRVQKLLLDGLGIDHLLAVVGGSIGGMQVLQWSTAYPDMMDAAIPSRRPRIWGLNRLPSTPWDATPSWAMPTLPTASTMAVRARLGAWGSPA